jgi:hypothetical protein
LARAFCGDGRLTGRARWRVCWQDDADQFLSGLAAVAAPASPFAMELIDPLHALRAMSGKGLVGHFSRNVGARPSPGLLSCDRDYGYPCPEDFELVSAGCIPVIYSETSPPARAQAPRAKSVRQPHREQPSPSCPMAPRSARRSPGTMGHALGRRACLRRGSFDMRAHARTATPTVKEHTAPALRAPTPRLKPSSLTLAAKLRWSELCQEMAQPPRFALIVWRRRVSQARWRCKGESVAI